MPERRRNATNETKATNASHPSPVSHPSHPDGFIPPHGGYENLFSYQKSQIIYDATVKFCDRFIDRKSRTHDQMVQAARSGNKNISEGSQVSGTSKEGELKLVNVARASLEELLGDYQDYLRQHGHPIGSNFIGAVAVGGDAVGADHNQVDAPFLHDLGRHIVADEGHINPGAHELPSRQPGALQERAGFIGIHKDVFALFLGHIYGRQGGAELGCGQSACIAMGQHGLAVFQKAGPVPADGAAHGEIFLQVGQGFLN